MQITGHRIQESLDGFEFEYDLNIVGLLSNLTFSDVCVQSISGRAIDVAVKTLMSDTMFFVSHKSNLSKAISVLLFAISMRRANCNVHQIWLKKKRFLVHFANWPFLFWTWTCHLVITVPFGVSILLRNDQLHLVWINYLFANLYFLSTDWTGFVEKIGSGKTEGAFIND